MTLLVVAEVAVPKTEPPLPMVKKTSWVSVGALGNCFRCCLWKTKQSISQMSATKPRIQKGNTKALKVVLDSLCFLFLKDCLFWKVEIIWAFAFGPSQLRSHCLSLSLSLSLYIFYCVPKKWVFVFYLDSEKLKVN